MPTHTVHENDVITASKKSISMKEFISLAKGKEKNNKNWKVLGTNYVAYSLKELQDVFTGKVTIPGMEKVFFLRADNYRYKDPFYVGTSYEHKRNKLDLEFLIDQQNKVQQVLDSI